MLECKGLWFSHHSISCALRSDQFVAPDSSQWCKNKRVTGTPSLQTFGQASRSNEATMVQLSTSITKYTGTRSYKVQKRQSFAFHLPRHSSTDTHGQFVGLFWSLKRMQTTLRKAQKMRNKVCKKLYEQRGGSRPKQKPDRTRCHCCQKICGFQLGTGRQIMDDSRTVKRNTIHWIMSKHS